MPDKEFDVEFTVTTITRRRARVRASGVNEARSILKLHYVDGDPMSSRVSGLGTVGRAKNVATFHAVTQVEDQPTELQPVRALPY